MTKTILAAVLSVGLASTALADRGDRYDRGGGLPVPPGVPAALVPGNRHSPLPAPPIPHGLPVPPVPRFLPAPPVPAIEVHGRYSYGYHSYRPYPVYAPVPVCVPRPIVYAPPVVYTAPVYCPPVVAAAPVYVPPPVVYVRPAPVVIAEPAPVSGFSASYYGGSYGSGLSIGFSYYH
jgi:hypothetical protein